VKTYLVFEPEDGGRGADSADDVVFLREKFYWLALLFAPLWLLWHRLWLGFAGWLLAVIVLGVAAYALGLNQQVSAVIAWLPSLVLAFEGSELRRRKLLRVGYRDAGVAIGADLEDAERRYFAAWAGPTSPAHSPRVEQRMLTPAASPTPPPAQTNPVIGLFPQPGGGR
jgi:hypothetical protein